MIKHRQLLPERMQLTQGGLKVTLVHTKTTGADKKVCSPVFMDLLQSGKIMQWIKAAKEARYSVLQGYCRDLKDAVLETAWNPERFYEWCIDSEEKMFIGDALSA